MQPRHRVSRAAIDLIKRFEGYRRQAAQLPDGRWTIGHGHTLTARQGAQVSPDDAEALLLYDLIAIAHGLDEAVFTPLSQNQFDALASFAFNLGLDNFRSSGVLKRLNEGALIQAACAMELWRKAEVAGERIVIDALVRRRSAEKTLFLTPEGDAWVPAPSPVLRPMLDTDAEELVPRQAPATVTTSMEGESIEVLREGEPAPPAPATPDDDDLGPAKAAAEAVTARLSTIFQEPEQPIPEAAEVEAAPEVMADEPQPEADVAPAPSPFEDELPFFLRAPEPETSEPEVEAPAEPEEDRGVPPGPDLFDPAPAAEALADEVRVAIEYDEADEERAIIDDMAPYEFVAPVVQPLPERPQGGAFTLIVLAVLGLAFFGGGVFWATNARPMLNVAWLEPKVVGWIAGIAGAFFFAAAAFLLLERLGQASERSARNRR